MYDNFRCVILYTSLRVETPVPGGGELEELNFNYEETPQRAESAGCFDAAARELERVSGLLRTSGQRERAHEALNIAQQAAAQKCLLAQDRHLEDRQKAAWPCRPSTLLTRAGAGPHPAPNFFSSSRNSAASA